VGEAGTGQEAIEACLDRRPDVVTMDIVLPGKSGLEATEYIMAHCPTPILVVSASFNRGELFSSYQALAAGAVDVIEKPTGNERAGVWEAQFLSALRIVSRVRVITHVRGKLAPTAATLTAPASTALGAHADVIAIGASTGGPSAMATVLGALPPEFDVPTLVVIHLADAFAAAFADWLGSVIKRPVALARDGERLSSLQGEIRVAPAGTHLSVRGSRLALDASEPRHSCRPSVDVLFESLARTSWVSVGVLLTGMGRDGARGLLQMRNSGAVTFAQDEATSVVYGMPREAIQIGAAARILALPEIGPALARFMRLKQEGPS
jgi:two-component system chemotaxis response regulator CheB